VQGFFVLDLSYISKWCFIITQIQPIDIFNYFDYLLRLFVAYFVWEFNVPRLIAVVRYPKSSPLTHLLYPRVSKFLHLLNNRWVLYYLFFQFVNVSKSMGNFNYQSVVLELLSTFNCTQVLFFFLKSFHGLFHNGIFNFHVCLVFNLMHDQIALVVMCKQLIYHTCVVRELLVRLYLKLIGAKGGWILKKPVPTWIELV
jgi:hypothetical protein